MAIYFDDRVIFDEKTFFVSGDIAYSFLPDQHIINMFSTNGLKATKDISGSNMLLLEQFLENHHIEYDKKLDSNQEPSKHMDVHFVSEVQCKNDGNFYKTGNHLYTFQPGTHKTAYLISVTGRTALSVKKINGEYGLYRNHVDTIWLKRCEFTLINYDNDRLYRMKVRNNVAGWIASPANIPSYVPKINENW